MTFGWQDLDVLVHVDNIRHFKTRKGPSRKDGFEGIQKLAQCWKSKLHITCTIEVKIDSLKNDGSQFWTVISRGMNKYVTKLPEENGTSTHGEEVAARTAKPVATKQKEQFNP